jgi:hypothetical protein
MALTNKITLDHVWLCECDADPTVSGFDAPIGSIATIDGGVGTWEKNGSGITNWIKLANEDLLQYSRHAPYNTITTLSAGTIVWTSATKSLQFFQGAVSGQIIQLPNATTLSGGWQYEIWNLGSATITFKFNDGTTFTTLGQNSYVKIILQDPSTAKGGWSAMQVYTSTLASGILNYNLVSSTVFSTTSKSDIMITEFSITPQAGTYAIWYNASTYYTTTPKGHWWSIYSGGSKITDSERRQDTAHSNQTMVDATMTIKQVSGAQTVDIRVRCDTTGTLTVNGRSLILIRLGP